MEKELINSIKQKEARLSKLEEHIEKSEVCADLYNKILIEKAVLKKQLDDLQNNTVVNRIKKLIPRREKLICDYFGK